MCITKFIVQRNSIFANPGISAKSPVLVIASLLRRSDYAKARRMPVNVITNPLGNKIMSLQVPESYNEVEINTRNLVAGIYYCHLYLGKELKEIKKLIILR